MVTKQDPNRIFMIIGVITLLIMGNCLPLFHNAIIGWDMQVVHAANGLLAQMTFVAPLIAKANTRWGDLAVISCLGAAFVTHGMLTDSRQETVRRLAFWAWVSLICAITYAGVCVLEELFPRQIPLAALADLFDVQKAYDIKLRTSATESFPSGHGLAYMLFTLMSWNVYRRMSLFIGAIGAVMLGLRLMIGVHWFSDIFFGSLPLALLVRSIACETPLIQSFWPIQTVIARAVSSIFGQRWLSNQPNIVQIPLRRFDERNAEQRKVAGLRR